MRKQKFKTIIASILACSMAVTLISCGTKEASAPELLSPVAGMDSYREVCYGDVGTMEICFGTIVPTQYAHFWTTNVTIDEIKVDVGDYVHAGDVLATANLEVAQDNLDDLSSSLSLLQTNYSMQDKIHTLKLQELNLKSEGLLAIGEADEASKVETEIATEEENARYDKLLYEHRVADLNEQMQEQREIIEDGTLTARASGYVSYVYSLVADGAVDSTTNVVVISDYDKPYIQVQDKTIDDDFLSGFDKFYTIQKGKKEELREYAYTAEERMVAENQKKFPALRMQYENESAMGTVGTVIPIFLVKNQTEDVLVVGNDSLYEDEKGTFVYVKNDDKREQRYIEVGIKDYANTEVVSGLEEGEKVFYTSESVWPEQYEPYVATVGDCEAIVNTERYSMSDTVRKIYKSEYEGSVVSVHAADHQNVKKGDLIAVVATNEGSAKLTEMRNEINATKKAYEEAKKTHDALVLDLEARKQVSYKPVVPEDATGTDAETATSGDATEIQNPNAAAMLDLEIQIENLAFLIQTKTYEQQVQSQEKQYKKISCNNDGSGNCAIYAESDGMITQLELREGQKLKLDDTMFYISVASNKKLSIPSAKNIALGSEIILTDKESGKTVTGKIYGNAGSNRDAAGEYYLTTVNQKVYVTQCVSTDGIRSYAQFEDASVYESEDKYMISYSTASLEDKVMIPFDLLYVEKTLKETDADRYYVWKIVDGNLEKQYINIVIFTTKYDSTASGADDMKICVLSGLKEGDTLAREVVTEEDE